MNQESNNKLLLLYNNQSNSCFSLLESSSSLSQAMFSDEAAASVSSNPNRVVIHQNLATHSSNDPMAQTISENQQPPKIKKKRSLPGNPDPDAEVIALSPKTLLATNRFVCEICSKGFQRDQNLQLHRRGHNLPWKLKQRNNKENRKKAYVCPEPSCIHHHPSRALGDLTGIKKHFCRKHGEKKWKCDKCSKIYAVQSDWKAHSKTCGTREYKCDCGTLFSRKDSFLTHRAFCDALAEESARISANSALMHRAAVASTIVNSSTTGSSSEPNYHLNQSSSLLFPFPTTQRHFANPPPPPPQTVAAATTHMTVNPWDPQIPYPVPIKTEEIHINPIDNSSSLAFYQTDHQHPFFLKNATFSIPSPQLSATALLQKAATIGTVSHATSTMAQLNGHVTVPKISPHDFLGFGSQNWQKNENLTRDFLGLTADIHDHDESSGTNGNGRNGGLVQVPYNGMDFSQTLYERDNSVMKHHQLGFGFGAAAAETTTASETWGNC